MPLTPFAEECAWGSGFLQDAQLLPNQFSEISSLLFPLWKLRPWMSGLYYSGLWFKPFLVSPSINLLPSENLPPGPAVWPVTQTLIYTSPILCSQSYIQDPFPSGLLRVGYSCHFSWESLTRGSGTGAAGSFGIIIQWASRRLGTLVEFQTNALYPPSPGSPQ